MILKGKKLTAKEKEQKRLSIQATNLLRKDTLKKKKALEKKLLKKNKKKPFVLKDIF